MNTRAAALVRRLAALSAERAELERELAEALEADEPPVIKPRARAKPVPPPPPLPAHPPSEIDRQRAREDLRRLGFRPGRKSTANDGG